MSFNPFDVETCRAATPKDFISNGGTRCLLLANHACEPHVGGNIWVVERDLVPPELFAQLFADVTAARDYHSKAAAWGRWIEVAPTRYVDADLATLDQPAEIHDQLDIWIGRSVNCEPHGCLVLMGDVGTGKTYAGMAVARAISACLTVADQIKLVSASRMFRSLRPDGGATIDDYTEPTLLLIDDIGTEKTSEWVEETLFTIVDQRWVDCQSTIVTTNLGPTGLREAVGDRVYDRIRDNATAITLTGPSRRAGSVCPMTEASK